MNIITLTVGPVVGATDVHASMSAVMTSPGAEDGFKIYSVISSAYFWPYPHTSAKTFIPNGQIQSILTDNVYNYAGLSPVHSTDNFTRITADPASLTIEVFARKGQLLSKTTLPF